MDKPTNLQTPDENPNESTPVQVTDEENLSLKTDDPTPVTATVEPSKAENKRADDKSMPARVYQDVAELDKLEQEYTPQEFESLAKLYEETMSDFSVGQVVLGKVLAVNDKEVSIDIGFKSEGTVPIDEFPDPSDVVVGDNIEVYIDDIEDAEGLLVLSKKKADFMQAWDRLINKFENGEIIEGRCARRIKGGIVVDLGGVDAFLPGSQIDVRPIRDFDALIGRNMEFKIVKVNHMRKNIVVSHRVLVEQELKGQREKILRDLERGQILEGAVKNITDFGVFIDLGGVDGLLHINDLSWGRVSHPSEIVSLDEKIKVVVLDFNEAKDRISLGLKQLQP
ncbi:S1 RNA-binding domain-containing protein, partial [candidate division KSB1 bacterium]|nr:S1 RNA-binding domain-containing protein [candidate division KSB1 bacterium]